MQFGVKMIIFFDVLAVDLDNIKITFVCVFRAC